MILIFASVRVVLDLAPLMMVLANLIFVMTVEK